jgi:hypothetical protein
MEGNIYMNQENINTAQTRETQVTVHLPDTVNEVIRQQKVNRIYDLLKADESETA